MGNNLQRPKGTQDILPDVAQQWQQVENTANSLFNQWGYGEIRTPNLEYTELFLRGVGETTDVVNKEMYRFEKSKRDYSLRPEGTAGVVRAFIENGLHRTPKPVRLWYTGPMFRYERPQAGRQRQFHQLGIEQFGIAGPSADTEVIALAWALLTTLGLPDLALEINDIGSAADREAFRNQLRNALTDHKTALCDTCQHRYTENPFRMLDCKNPSCQTIYSGQPIQALLAKPWTNADSQAHFATVTKALTELGIPWQRNHTLVRGLDYYNGPVFEITTTKLGAQNTVCGGGRYDSLVETLGGPETPGVGWALGLERLISLLPASAPVPPDVWVAIANTSLLTQGMQAATQLRNKGYTVDTDLSHKKIGKQIDAAAKRGIKHVVLVEPEREITVKTLTTSQQTPLTDFLNQPIAGR